MTITRHEMINVACIIVHKKGFSVQSGQCLCCSLCIWYVVTHRGDPGRRYTGSGSKYRELVLEGKDRVYPKRAERGPFPEDFPRNVKTDKGSKFS